MTLKAYISYNLPSVEALVHYFHVASGFPVRDTWLSTIKEGNYRTCPGLTLDNVTAYFPSVDETIKGHMVQLLQRFRSTKTKKILRTIPSISPYNSPLPSTTSSKIHMHIVHIIKPYTYNTGRLQINARSGNQYLIVAYHCD